jgi:hypothetical protein
MGAGNRQGFRDIIQWLGDNETEWVAANIHLIPMYGRWDDLMALYGTAAEPFALELWADAIQSDDASVTPLACKWADRQDSKLRKACGLGPKEFRKLVSEKTGWVVEKSMCSGNWENIPFSQVPSVAGSRYRNAFKKHQQARYEQWCLSLATNKKVNAATLFPHDIVRLVHSTPDADAAFTTLVETLFENMPNYIDNPDVKIMPICDFSGSMDCKASGSVSCLDVSLALGLYCSDRLGKNNPFYRKLIPFSTNSKLESWVGRTVIEAVRSIPNGYCGSTNIRSALENLLNSAKMWNVKPNDMVNTLLILSDMQWDGGAVDDTGKGVIESCMKQWEAAGYKRPQIVYWNLNGYNNQPATVRTKNVCMVSGFSPTILKTVLNNEDIDPIKIMLATIAKYDITVPS